MANWLETYPHTITASVILKNNKIRLWKLGQNKLSEDYTIESLVSKHPEYSYMEKDFIVNNKEEHSEVFNKLGVEWFNKWELHDDFKGLKPY